MYETTSNTTLAQLLNQFSAPMFAVERANCDTPFYFVGINHAMERAGKCTASDLVGKALNTLMPPTELAAVLRHYEHCVLEQAIVRFEDTFTLRDIKATWDTTLQFVEMADGRQRIIGTTVQQSVPKPTTADTDTYDDIHYFSTMADFQLQNLISMFETHNGTELFKNEADVRLEKLSGMCRTVQRAVEDIKKVVSSAQQRNQPKGANSMHRPSSNTARARTMRSGMLNALIVSSSEWDQDSN